MSYKLLRTGPRIFLAQGPQGCFVEDPAVLEAFWVQIHPHLFIHFPTFAAVSWKVPLKVQDQTIHPQHSPHRWEQLAWGAGREAWVGGESGCQGDREESFLLRSDQPCLPSSHLNLKPSLQSPSGCMLHPPIAQTLSEAPSAPLYSWLDSGLTVKGPGRLRAGRGVSCP